MLADDPDVVAVPVQALKLPDSKPSLNTGVQSQVMVESSAIVNTAVVLEPDDGTEPWPVHPVQV